MKDYYQILGLSKGASDAEIKKAYRRLAKQYHPDVNKGAKGAEDRFKEISEAYSVLSDKEKKKQYDMFGSGAFHGGFDPSQGYRWSPQGEDQQGYRYYTSSQGPGQQNFEGFGDLGDIFGELFNMGGFTHPGGRKRPKGQAYKKAAKVKGGDTYTTLDVSFEEAIKGTSKKMSIQRDGKVDNITVKIPAGVDNGSRVRIKGKGHQGQNGGKPGDLYLNVRVKPHKTFWREGEDLFVEVPISIFESIFGGKIDVPTLSGSAKMTIPSETDGGQKFRLKGKGAPKLGKKGKGDQYVIVNIVPPKKINKETKQLLEDLAENAAYNPRK